MAEAIVSLVMEQLGSIIRQELEQKVRQVVGVRNEVKKLNITLGFIKAVLDDAEKKQFHENAVKAWIGELKDIMYDADDVLDEWYTTISISQSQHKGAASGSRTTNKVISFFSSPCSCFQPVVFRRDIALRIKDIRGRLDDVARDKEQLNLLQSQSYEGNRPRELTSSIVVVSEIHGRDDDKASILSRVLPENSDQGIQASVPIICIVGMGGLGKTALAQLVFNDEQVTETFKHKIWVCVSEPFDRERVAKEIIVQASKKIVQDVVGWPVLHERLGSSISGKQFLLVLDDVWTQNPSDWKPLKDSLVGGAAGSRIIITTRSEGVAKIVGASYIHLLKQLPEDHCWSLFRHMAFQGRSQQEIEKFEEIGREIARKCKGVPLAAKIVGSLMQFKQTKQEWRSVLQSDIWELEKDFDPAKDFYPALMLSYHSLPAHLKQCFMYTAIFPKDTKLKKDRLVKLWMAQGFVRSSGQINVEIVAGGYFDDLAMRSFFQDFEKDDDGVKIISCKMHDFLHDVAQSLTKDECLIMETDDSDSTEAECQIMETNDSDPTNYNKLRHVNASNAECSSPLMAKNLRTLILESSTPREVLKQLFLQSTCLRALDLHGGDLEELPDEVQCLVHLRYLDLSKNMLSILPETLCNLYNLQTLKLSKCRQLGRLPEGIGRLSNLRHLEAKDTDKLEYIPQSIGKLSQLRTLHNFCVSGASGGCKVGELRHLNSITGSLKIRWLRQVENVEESKGAQMLKKKDLGYLWLDFDYSQEESAAIEIEEVKRMEGVLEGLQPNANLEELTISDYPGLTFPFWISSTLLLCNVTTMELTNCRNCNQLPALGNLESLETLVVFGMRSLKHIGAEFYGVGGDTCFPKLQALVLDSLPKWEDWEIPFSKFKKVMPRLRYLKVVECIKLMGLPALGRLESLENISMENLVSLKEVGSEFLGISSSNGGDGGKLCLEHLDAGADLVQIPDGGASVVTVAARYEETSTSASLSPNVVRLPKLTVLTLKNVPKLKVLPPYMFPHSLRILDLGSAPQLKVIPCLPPLLEKMTLFGDLGVVSMSLMSSICDHDYPNLKTVEIFFSPHSSLPQGLSKFTSLQRLDIWRCNFLDLKPEEELRGFPTLQQLEISFCPVISERCEREDWANTLSSHIAYNIKIDYNVLVPTGEEHRI